jgi:hypothetical protein
VSSESFARTPSQRSAIQPFLRPGWLAVTLLVAACSSISKGGDPQISSWNAVWPTAPDHAYWGTWKSPSADAWLQIESTGEGALFREAGEPAGWVRTQLRVVPSQWRGGWDFVTEAGTRYRLRGTGDDWIAVSGPGGEQRYARATLPAEVSAATPYRPSSADEGQAAFNTDENWADSWWPF